MNKIGWMIGGCVLSAMLFLCGGTTANAGETVGVKVIAMAENMEEAEGTEETEKKSEADISAQEWWDALSMDPLEAQMERLTKGQEIDYRQLFLQLISGHLEQVKEALLTLVKTMLIGSADGCKGLFMKLLLLGIGAAVCHLFGDLFQDSQVADIGFFMVYLLMIAVMFTAFKKATTLSMEVLKSMADFVPVFLPAYIATIGLSCGTGTAMGYYTLLMMAASLLGKILMKVAVPLVYVYLILAVMNGLWLDEKITLLLDLCKHLLENGLKVLLGLVAGWGMVQSMLLPVLDAVKENYVQRTLSMLPGVGNISDQVVRMTVGSFVLLRNSLGLFGCICLMLICLAPLCRIVVMVAVMKLSTALVGLISDKRLVHCMNRIADGALLLFKVVGMAMMMLLLLMSMACYLRSRVG